MYHVFQKMVLSILLQQVSDAVRHHCSTIIYFVVLYRHITCNFSSPNIFDEKRFRTSCILYRYHGIYAVFITHITYAHYCYYSFRDGRPKIDPSEFFSTRLQACPAGRITFNGRGKTYVLPIIIQVLTSDI